MFWNRVLVAKVAETDGEINGIDSSRLPPDAYGRPAWRTRGQHDSINRRRCLCTPRRPPAAGVSIASLVCGIGRGCWTTWIPVVGFIGLICGIAGLITGIIGAQRPNGRPMAIIGIVCSALGLLIFIAWLVFWVIAIGAAASAPNG